MATCLHPIILKDRNIVPCGKCPVCRQNQRQSRADRFYLAGAFSKSVYFVTLTYSDENLTFALPPCQHTGNWLPAFNYVDLRNFFQRLDRKGLKYKYFVTSEYGEQNHRPHYHILFFMLCDVSPIQFDDYINESWNGDRTQTLIGNDALEAYACGYVLKDDLYSKTIPDRLTIVNCFPDFPESYKFKSVKCDKWDVRNPNSYYSKGIGKESIPFLNEYIFNNGNYREFFQFGKKRVSFDRYIKNNIDPSIKAELENLRMQRQTEINDKLMQSRNLHGKYDSFGEYHPDYFHDSQIMKRRYQLKQLKKQSKL